MISSNENMKVIALDIEGTLISNAVSQIPRPGLYDFLKFCADNFDRVAFFTAVSLSKVRKIIDLLYAEGLIPAQLYHNWEYIEWSGEFKNLDFIEGVDNDECVIIDDQQAYIHPEQTDNWIQIREFVYPYYESDRELIKMKSLLEKISP